MAPELCSQDVVDFPRLRVLPGPDVWAAGCLLHVLLLGTAPLEGPGPAQSKEDRRKVLGDAGDANLKTVVGEGDASPAARGVLEKLLTVDHNLRPACGDALLYVEGWGATKAAVGAGHLAAFRARKLVKPRRVTVVAAAPRPGGRGSITGGLFQNVRSSVYRPRSYSQRAQSLLRKQPAPVAADDPATYN